MAIHTKRLKLTSVGDNFKIEAEVDVDISEIVSSCNRLESICDVSMNDRARELIIKMLIDSGVFDRLIV